jgi:hypothetical protein
LRAEGLAGNILVKGLVHGVVGGALAAAQGGNFLQGFAANAVGAGTGLFSSQISGDNIALDTAIVGAAGGAVSVLTGGKFASGFVTAAFANLFNKYGQILSRAGWWVGAGIGGTAAFAGSIPADAATGGLNILATPAEVTMGALGGGRWGSWIGYGVGSVVDIINGTTDDIFKGALEPLESRYIPQAVKDAADQAATDPDGKMRCPDCGAEMTTEPGTPDSREFDHRDPYSSGGGNGADNIDSICRTCNLLKGAKTLDEHLGVE